jgi:hypothetical protein
MAATIVKDIESVLSLRSALRNPSVPLEILPSIELIRSCIKSGTDTHGWRRTEWRGAGGSSGATGSGGGSSSGGGGGYKGSYHKHHAPGSRHGGSCGGSGSTSHSVFSSRGRGGPGGAKAPTSDVVAASIPLVGPTTVASGGAGTVAASEVPVRHISHKYVSKFKKSSDNVEDTILNTILLGKLNKFSEANYDEIKEFITHIINNGETDMIKCFMKLVFEKAASEEMYCPLYAKLLSELSTRYPVLLTEMANLYVQYMRIFEEVHEDEAASYNEFCKRNVEQKYRRGYSQFLAELTKHNVIDSDTFMKTVLKIITQIDVNIKKKESLKLIEEYADCLMRIMRAIKSSSSLDDSSTDSDSDDRVVLIRATIKSDLLTNIRPLTVKNPENLGVSNKARFTFLDIYEDIQKF